VQASTAAWTAILNNDIIVAPGFREGLVGFGEEAGCDIVSPAKGDGELDYPFPEFAAAFLEKMGSVCRFGLAYGSCFMVHRRVFDAVGLFDTQVGLAGNEDEDFFRRARAAGFRLGVTGRAFLHHFGSVTQRSVKAGMGLPNSAQLSDKAYYHRKHRLTWYQRRWERLSTKIRTFLWRRREQRRFGLTLNMRRHGGQWQYE
jgi:N-acetylglucosaminyl-diphospho-decaprenol L-rhamnosyltransferase